MPCVVSAGANFVPLRFVLTALTGREPWEAIRRRVENMKFVVTIPVQVIEVEAANAIEAARLAFAELAHIYNSDEPEPARVTEYHVARV